MSGGPRSEASKAARRKWEKANSWRYQDECPRCGGPKWKTSKLCWHCRSFNTSAYRSYGQSSGDGGTVG